MHTLVTLGTPHGGSLLAYGLPVRLGHQLRPGSDLLTELALPAPPCRTRFVAYYSDLDQVVIPHENGRIDHPDLLARNVAGARRRPHVAADPALGGPPDQHGARPAGHPRCDAGGRRDPAVPAAVSGRRPLTGSRRNARANQSPRAGDDQEHGDATTSGAGPDSIPTLIPSGSAAEV